MKLSFPSPLQALRGLKILIFHPMLYLALLIHWGLISLPSPVEESGEDIDELLDESIPVASSASLGVKSKKPPQNSAKDESKQKKKPKPLAEALVKSDPELAKLAQEKKRQEEAKKKAEEEKKKAEEAKRKAEEAQKKNQEEQNKEANSNKDDEQGDEKSESQKDDTESDTDNISSDNNQDDAEQTSDSDGDESGNETQTAQQFNLELLPKPELVFTSDSLAAYNPGFNSLTFQPNVEDARTLETTTSIDKAIQAITQLDEYQSFEFGDPIFDDRRDPEESGLGVVYKIQTADSTRYVSFIRRSSRWARKNKKNTLRSTTVFVLWSEDPTG